METSEREDKSAKTLMHYLRFRVLCRGRSVCNELPAGYIYIYTGSYSSSRAANRARARHSQSRALTELLLDCGSIYIVRMKKALGI